MAGELEGRVAVVTGADAEPTRGLAAALAGAGAAVARIGDELLRDARSIEAAFVAAEEQLGGPPDVVVHGYVPAIALEPVPFEQVDDARWDAVWEGTMQTALLVLQAAHRRLHGRDGRIVLVTPTVSMSGAAGLVPYTTAIEGLRLLGKSAARQWGPDGITVNCLAPAPEHVAIGVDSTSVSLAPAALGGPGDAEHDLGPVAVFLAGAGGRFVTGLTLSVDGGVWMAP